MSMLITEKAYDPLKNNLWLFGQKVTGFSSDSMVSISRSGDVTIPHIGVRGEISVALNRDTTAVMTFSIQQTSEFNKYINAYEQALRATGFVPIPVQLEGHQGASILTIGWLQKITDVDYGAEVASYQYDICLMDGALSFDELQSYVSAVSSLIGI